MKAPHWLIRFRSWEYWPMWVLYIPVVLKHIQCTLQTGSPFFFLKVNPGIEQGFILSDPKSDLLLKLPPGLRPVTLRVPPGVTEKELEGLIGESALGFPMVLKPDIGFRGLKVRVVRDYRELWAHLGKSGVTYLLQEYVDMPVELGVFWFRNPHANRGEIPSLTVKEFMTVKGDGASTLEALVDGNPRWRLQIKRLEQEYPSRWRQVLPKGELLLLEPIGNHNRGTKFLNGRELIDEALLDRIEQICDHLPGFYFGRFDIKVNSLEEFKSGGPVKVLEVNGVGAEPTHVYQPGYSLWKAWGEMSRLWGVAAGIAVENKRNGHQFPVFSEAKARYLQYRSYKRKAL